MGKWKNGLLEVVACVANKNDQSTFFYVDTNVANGREQKCLNFCSFSKLVGDFLKGFQSDNGKFPNLEDEKMSLMLDVFSQVHNEQLNLDNLSKDNITSIITALKKIDDSLSSKFNQVSADNFNRFTDEIKKLLLKKKNQNSAYPLTWKKNLDFNNDEANIDPNMLQKFQYLKEEINGIFSQENIATIKGGFSDTCSKGHIHSHDLSTAERGKIQKKVKNVLRSFLESVNTPIPPYLNEYEDDVRGILEFYDQMKEDIGELMTTGMNLRGNKCGAVDEVPKVSPEVKTTLEQLAEENLDVYDMPLTTLKRVVQEVSQVFDRASQIFGFSTDNKMTRFTNFSSLSTVLNKRRLGQSKPSIITRVSSCSSVDSDYSRAPLLGRRS